MNNLYCNSENKLIYGENIKYKDWKPAGNYKSIPKFLVIEGTIPDKEKIMTV